MREALITNFINIFFHVIWFYNLALEPKHGKKKMLLISITDGILFELIYLVLAKSGLPEKMVYLSAYLLASVVLGGGFVLFLSASHPGKSVFLVSTYYSLWTFIYCFISVVTGSPAGTGNSAVWGLRAGLNLFFLSVYLIFFREKLRRIYSQMQNGYGLIACISSLTFVMMTFLTFYNEWHREKSMGHVFVMTLCYLFMLIVYVLLFYFMVQENRAYQLRLMLVHEKALKAQVEAYEKTERSVRQTRHDFRHHNTVVMALAEQRDYEGILAYLKEYEQIEEEKCDRRYCKNHAVNNLIAVYMRRAKPCGIAMNADIRLDKELCVSDVDLVSVLSNMLENAVHGCMEVAGERRIEIAAQQENAMILLRCQNSCTDDIHFCDGIPQAKDHEGVGVDSIRSIAEKYGGDAHFSAEKGVFTCSVLLWKEMRSHGC